MTLARRLEDELFAVGGEIGFGILAAESQLPHVAQVLFVGKSEWIILCVNGYWIEDNCCDYQKER
jgi:hypothetical protein